MKSNEMLDAGQNQSQNNSEIVDKEQKQVPKNVQEKNAIKTFFSGNKQVWRNATMVIVINILVSLVGMFALGAQGSMVWVGIIAYIVVLAVDILFVCIIARNCAFSMFNASRVNVAIGNSQNKVPKFKMYQQYKGYKGYVIGAVASIPFVILILISLFLQNGAYIAFSGVFKIIYGVFYIPFGLINAGKLHIAFALIGLAINVLSFGIPYHLYGMKLEAQQSEIDKEVRELHQEHFDYNNSHETDV